VFWTFAAGFADGFSDEVVPAKASVALNSAVTATAPNLSIFTPMLNPSP
jgi:hypothetical protein